METHLRLLPDFSRLAKKLQRGKGSLQVGLSPYWSSFVSLSLGLCAYIPGSATLTKLGRIIDQLQWRSQDAVR